MSGIDPNYYEILGVSRIADFVQINAAYRRTLVEAIPELAESAGERPFARSQVQKFLKAAGKAHNTLKNPGSRAEYDKTLPKMTSHQASAGSAYNNLKLTSFTPLSLGIPPPIPPDAEPLFSHGVDSQGTEIRVLISRWCLALNISRKFDFTGHIEQRHDTNTDYDEIKFDIGLKRNLVSNEVANPTINELALRLEHIPDDLKLINISTLFKETPEGTHNKLLTLTLTAGRCMLHRPPLPLEFGFDFDLNHIVTSHPRSTPKAGTCMLFSWFQPPDWLKASRDSLSGPDRPLRKEEGLKADEFIDLEDAPLKERCMRVRYGEVQMWRLAGLGFRVDRRAPRFRQRYRER